MKGTVSVITTHGPLGANFRRADPMTKPRKYWDASVSLLENCLAALNYDAKTGLFTRKAQPGCVAQNGYRYIKVGPKPRLAHRLAWLMHYGVEPGGLVDHINGDREDNRIDNLRIATFSQNAANAKLHTRNTSGLKGASRITKRGRLTDKWQSSITVQNKRVHLGTFDTKEAAHAAYLGAARKHYGEYANDGQKVPITVPVVGDWLPAATLSFGA
jgi:hypothetical protein